MVGRCCLFVVGLRLLRVVCVGGCLMLVSGSLVSIVVCFIVCRVLSFVYVSLGLCVVCCLLRFV